MASHVLVIIAWGLLVCLVHALPSAALTYGPGNETPTTTGSVFVDGILGADCTTGNYSKSNRACNGSDGNAYNTVPEGVVVLTPGQTLLIRAGTYTHTSRIATPAGTASNRITIKNYNGESVTLNGIWDWNSYNTIAGLIMNGGTSGHNFQFGSNTTGIIVRNNTVTMEAAGSSGFRLGNNVNTVEITGNLLIAGSTLANETISISTTKNVLIARNKFTHIGTATSGDHISLQTNWLGTAGQFLTIEENWFASVSVNAEEAVDLKAPAENQHGGWVIRKNHFDGVNLRGCTLLWGNHAGSTGTWTGTVENNRFLNCGTLNATGHSMRFYPGSTTNPLPNGVGLRARNNLFICPGGGSTQGLITFNTDGFTFDHNTVYRCNMNFDTGTQNPSIENGIVRSNIFYGMSWTGSATSGTWTCSNNTSFSVTGAPTFAGQCTNARTDDPLFVNAAAGNFSVTDTDQLNTGHDGKTRGAFQHVALGMLSTITSTQWQVNLTMDFTPPDVVCGSLTPRRTAPSVASGTAGSCMVNGATVTFTVAGFTPVSGDTLVLDGTVCAFEDKRDLGGPEVDKDGCSLAFTGTPVTNNISGTAPTLTSCTVGDINRNKIRGTFNTKGSSPMVPGGCPTGWSARDDGVGNTITSCVAVGSAQIEFTATSNFTAGVIDLSYAPASGTTTNSAMVEVASATNLPCQNDIGTSPPTIISGHVFNAARNEFFFTVDIGNSTTLLPATGMTGISCTEGGAARTLTTCDRVDATHFRCLATVDITPATALLCSYNQGTGNITDDALVEMVAFTNLAVVNEVQSETFTLTSTHCRTEFPHVDEAPARWHSADGVAAEVAPSGVFRGRCQLGCTGANCPSQPFAWWASDNGGMFYRVDNAFDGHLIRYAADKELTTPLPDTTRQLMSCTFTTGKIYTNPVVISPALAVPVGGCTEYGGVFEISPAAQASDTITLQVQKDIGGGVIQTIDLDLVVIGSRYTQ